jgi:hypothetical protein
MASVAVARDSALALSPSVRRGLGVAAIFAATMVAPAAMLLGMPILLGPAHLANDFRYLILPLPRIHAAIAIMACVAIFGLQIIATATGLKLAGPQAAIVAAWFLASVALGRTTPWRLGIAAAAAITIAWLPAAFLLLAGALHNAIALLAWRLVARPARRQVVAMLALVAVATALAVLVGPAIAAQTGGAATRWLSVDGVAASMLPGIPASHGILIAIAFLQAVHYAIWIAWIPADAPRARPRGTGAAVVGATLAIIAVALVDAAWARATYLALATFHIYLEIVIFGARALRRPS